MQERRERHEPITLTREQIEEIAELAAEKGSDKALNKIITRGYTEVGKAFFSKVIWITGAIIVGITMYLQDKGIMK